MILRNKFILFLELLFLLTTISQFFNIPSFFNLNNFDGQNLLVWKYASEFGLLPYKDIFYPYGLMQYWAESNIIWGFVQSLLLFVLLNGLLYSILYLCNSKNYAYGIFLFVFGFILLVTGISVFERYGILVVFALLLASLLLQNKLSQTIILIIGVLSSSLFFLVTDQGTLMLFWALFFFVCFPVIKNPDIIRQKSYYLTTINRIFIFGIGVLIGSIPFVLYLQNNNSFVDFVVHYVNLGIISEYAKTPYFHSLGSWEGQLNISVLFISIFYLSFKYFFLKRKFDKKTLFIIALTFVLLILEQKSIVRSIDNQLTFISVLLASILISPIIVKIFNSKSLAVLLGLIIIIIIFNLTYQRYTFDMYKKNSSQTIAMNMIGDDTSYLKVINRLKKEINFNGKIFSFPGDPIFYILNNQKPPYFFTVYEGTPLYGQNKRIEYIENNNIEYLILNSKVSAIQDGVPDYVRATTELKYILNNYTVVHRLDNFLILNKSKEDFFRNRIFNRLPDFKSYLLDINLANIPRSEGIKKAGIVKIHGKVLVKSLSINDINTFLKSKNIRSSGIFIILTPTISIKKNTTLSIEANTHDLKTKIYFKSCSKNTPCIINLSNTPLFYKDRIVNEILLDDKFTGIIELVSGLSADIVW